MSVEITVEPAPTTPVITVNPAGEVTCTVTYSTLTGSINNPGGTNGSVQVKSGTGFGGIAPGAAGQVLTSTGTAWVSTTPASGGMIDPGSNGVVVRTALNTTTARSIAAGTNVSVTNGSGVSGNPTINVPDASTSVKGAVELATDGEAASGLAVQSNDARLSNARTPTAHASTHVTGGTDKIRDATASQDGLMTTAYASKLDGITGINTGDVTIDATLADVATVTGQVLSADDLGSDKLWGWDESAGKVVGFTLGTNLTVSDTTINATGGGTPGGTNTQVQFNDGGSFGGDAGLTYDKTTDTLSATNLTVSGLSTLNHIHGSIAGSLYIHVKNTSGVTIPKGTPVYATGNVGSSDRVQVSAADYTNPAKMPAIGVLDATLADNGESNAVIVGEITELATDSYANNQELFVGTAGLLGALPTTGEAQSIAVVSRVHASTGIIVVNAQARLNAALRALANNVGSGLTALNASSITSGSLADAYIASAATWNAKQNAGSYITALTGDVTASGPGSVAATLANTAVTPGSYTSANITVDSKGRVTAAANGSGGTVTSVAMTVPTGLAVTGSPITSNGTLAVSYDTGYQGFTAAESSKLAGIEASADVTDAANVGAAIHGTTGKTTPVDADALAVIDSAASNALKKTTWANIKATLKTYFDTLYNLYVLPTPTTTVIGGVKRNTGSAGQFVNGIDTDGALQYGTPSGGGSGDMTKAVYDPQDVGYISGATGAATNSGTGGIGGVLFLYGGNGDTNIGGLAGTVITVGGNGDATGNGGNGGDIDTRGGIGNDGGHNGGSINTSGNLAPGGSINTSDGGGSINTRGTGSIGLGATGTRTTIQGAASADWTLTLPANDGDAGQYLKTDGAGVTSWDTPAGGVSDGDKGDITVSSSGTVWTIDNSAVTLAKMANLAQDQFIGRTTASTGVPQTATITAAARTVLDDTSTSAMRTTLGVGTTSSVTFGSVTTSSISLNDAFNPGNFGQFYFTDGTSQYEIAPIGTAGTYLYQLPSLNGYFHISDQPDGKVNLPIGVTGDLPLVNFQPASVASVLLGRGSASGAGDFQEITVGSGLTMSGTTLSATVGGTVAIANGGTGQTTAVAAFDALAPTTTKGDLIVHNGTDNIRVAVGATNGHVLTVDSAEASGVKWAAGGGGAIVFTTQVSTTDTQSLSSETWTDITNLAITRSPTSSSSKIRLRAVIQCATNGQNNGMALRFVRGSTPVGVGVATGSRTAAATGLLMCHSNLDSMLSTAIEFDDEPATVASTTWKVQFIMLTGGTGTAYINRSHSDSNADFGVRARSVFTLEEIAP